MNTTSRIASLFVMALLVAASQDAQAASLQINSIAPFDTNLGTLTHVQVVLDPVPVPTNPYNSSIFEIIDPHQHTASPLPVAVAGLGSFTFAPVQTSSSSSGPSSSHNHIVNLFPSVKNFAGAGLSWFLNPGNTPINSVSIPFFHTSFNVPEDHDHTVNPFPIVPLTTFTFDPIPEPATFGLLALGVLTITIRRRRP